MNVSIDFEYLPCHDPLVVHLSIANCDRSIDLQQSTKHFDFDIKLPVLGKNQELLLRLSTDNFKIVECPLIVKKIMFDEFYQRDQFCFRGSPKFSQQFIDYARQKKFYIDPAINDSNQLNFVGSLDFVFKWPIWRNILT